jgi:hypothetical protein
MDDAVVASATATTTIRLVAEEEDDLAVKKDDGRTTPTTMSILEATAAVATTAPSNELEATDSMWYYCFDILIQELQKKTNSRHQQRHSQVVVAPIFMDALPYPTPILNVRYLSLGKNKVLLDQSPVGLTTRHIMMIQYHHSNNHTNYVVVLVRYHPRVCYVIYENMPYSVLFKILVLIPLRYRNWLNYGYRFRCWFNTKHAVIVMIG